MMETTSDTLELTLKGNEDLKLELSGKQPGDKMEICLQVTVTSVDDDRFEAAIDEVVTDDCSSDNKDDSAEETDDSEDPVMVVVARKKPPFGAKSDE
jgi:hypothetical protein